HVDQFAFPEERNRGGGRRISDEVGACTFGSFDILAGKNCKNSIRLGAMLQGSTNCRTHTACGTPTDGIHDDHCSSLLSAQLFINLGGGFQFLHTQGGEFLAHACDHYLWIHCSPSWW